MRQTRLTRRHLGKFRIHAGIPTTEPLDAVSGVEVLDVVALTGRADKGAGPTPEAGLRQLRPRRVAEEFLGLIRPEFIAKIGDKVCALLGGGGYAEYVNVKYDMLMPVPKNCTMAEAAAIPEAFATAYLNLFIEGKIKRGNTLLITAGGSGLASVVIPMAKAFGVRVITTVSTEEKAERIKYLKADRVVVTTKEDLSQALKEELVKDKGVDVAIDCLGGETMGKCLHYLSHGARWIMIAALAGQKTEIDLKNVYVRNVRIIGSTLRSRTPEVKAQILAELVKNVWDKVENGEIKPTIYKILPITKAEEAHDILYKSKNVGKVVLKVD